MAASVVQDAPTLVREILAAIDGQDLARTSASTKGADLPTIAMKSSPERLRYD